MRRPLPWLCSLLGALAFAVPSKLSKSYEELWTLLKQRPASEVTGVDGSLHELAPSTARKAWDELKVLVTEKEQPTELDGSKYVSLRLDGCMFGRLTRELRELGLIGRGYSEEIGEIMKLCCRAMMDEFKGNVAYTHSDEMTILMFPRTVGRRGEPFEWPHKGRIQKWVSIGASIVTALFNRRLAHLARGKGLRPPMAHFDCRVGLYNEEAEAKALLLWRAYDCSVNCVQDACHHLGAPLDVVRSDFAGKLQWLQAQGLLPLRDHQAYGSLFVKSAGEFQVKVTETNETVSVTRKVNIHANDGAHGPRNLLLLPRHGLELVPQVGDARLELREGSYWRHVGTSGTPEAQETRQARGRRKRRPQGL